MVTLKSWVWAKLNPSVNIKSGGLTKWSQKKSDTWGPQPGEWGRGEWRAEEDEKTQLTPILCLPCRQALT